MNLNVPGVIMLLGGLLLTYAAVKNVDPREIIRSTIKGEQPNWGTARKISPIAPMVPPVSGPVNQPPVWTSV
jgi:hypothetical protein